MPQSNESSLFDRMDALERQVNRLSNCNRVLVIILLGLSGAIALGMTQRQNDNVPVQRLIKTRGIHIVDQNGRTVAEFGATEDEGAVFVMHGRPGHPSLTISAKDQNPQISMFDKSGKLRYLASVSDNGPLVGMHGSKGQIQFATAIREDGPAMIMFSNDGTRREWKP